MATCCLVELADEGSAEVSEGGGDEVEMEWVGRIGGRDGEAEGLNCVVER